MARQVAELFLRLGIAHHRADRHRHVQVLAAAPGAVVGATGLAVAGTVSALDAEVRQRVDAGDGAQVDAAAEAPVTAVRAAQRHELLAPETAAAAAAVAGLHFRLGLVDEFHRGTLAQTKTPALAGVFMTVTAQRRGGARQAFSGSTLTYMRC